MTRFLLLGLLACVLLSRPAAAAETLTLSGVMTGADHQTYREVRFTVPAGTTSLTVAFRYTGQDQKSVIDLGLRDPERFRGWSGGNKAQFTLTETWATPSYLAGPLPAGEWTLILGVPNLRQNARAEYVAEITLDDRRTFDGFAAAPLRAGPGWYRGDLHLHTGHSDGACASRTGRRTPCPLFRSLEAAAARGLDFVAVTEHNTTSHIQALAEAQPYYDDLLLIPGREITTFHGHANVFGTTAPIDFQLGGPKAPDVGTILDQAESAGGLVSINHPALPSGEACMGCGWTAPTDFARIPLLEVVNGVTASGPLSGIGVWEGLLNAGHRITAIGGSDNHDATLSGRRGVGAPTTVVYADALSQPAILAGLRAGHVFIDVEGAGRHLDVTARRGKADARMGDRLAGRSASGLHLNVVVKGAAGGRIVIRSDSPALSSAAPVAIDGDVSTTDMALRADGRARWVRVEVLGPGGSPWLIGNPIYLR